MLEFFTSLLDGNAWAVWGIVLLIALPVLVVSLSEAGDALRRSGRNDLARAVTLLAMFGAPMLVVVLTLHQVAGLEASNLLVRIADTVFWIGMINISLLLFNVMIFGESDRPGLQTRTPKLFLDLLRLFLVLLGTAIVISKIWGVDLGGLLTALGVGSIVIGLAMQDTLSSLFSGIALLSARHYREGDWLQVGGSEGVVVAMNWRSISLRTRSGDILVIPNIVLAKEQIRNVAASTGWHAEFVELELSYDHPPEQIKALVIETLLATQGVLAKPPPECRLKSFGDHSICYAARLFVADYGRLPVIKNEFRSLFWYRAQRDGIVFPASHNRLYRTPAAERVSGYDTPRQRAELLAGLGLLDRTPDQLVALMERSRVNRFGKNELIIKAGKVADRAYVVVEGSARAMLPRSGDAPLEVHEFGPGRIILFKSLFRSEPSHFDVVSETALKVIDIPADALTDYLATDPDLAQEIEQIVSQREEAALRVIEQELPAGANGVATGGDDRVKLLEDMFRA